MSNKAQSAFALVEFLVVLAIVGVLAAIIFPFISSTRMAAEKTCLSDQRQLGLAAQCYAQDFDDRTPGDSSFSAAGHSIPTGFGWAGKIYPYAKSKGLFACGVDDTAIDGTVAAPGSVVLSYGANENLSSISLSQATSASRTVFLFEVTGSFADISKPDEGASSRLGVYTKYSAVGNGIKGSLIESNTPWTGSGNGISTFYATGILDNSDNSIFADDFGDVSPRHNAGANYLALDGHVVWAGPPKISAGGSAKQPSDPQSSTGCGALASSAASNLPCAEGTGDSRHVLTFSRT